MDPTACLRRINEAAADGDRDELIAALEDQTLWLTRGGFMPKPPSDPSPP